MEGINSMCGILAADTEDPRTVCTASSSRGSRAQDMAWEAQWWMVPMGGRRREVGDLYMRFGCERMFYSIGQKRPPSIRRPRGRHPQPEGHRAVVDEPHLHVRAEHTATHGGVERRGPHAEMAEQALALGRRRGRGEARTLALAGVGGQGELRHQEEAALHLAEVQVHAPLGIREHPV